MADIARKGDLEVKIVDNTSQTPASVNTDGTLNALQYGAEQTGSYPDPSSAPTGNNVSANIDAFGNLLTRGPILTDEDSFRDDFSGSALNARWTPTISGGNNSLTIANSLATMVCGQVNGNKTNITTPLDYCPMQVNVQFTISQRIANQSAYISLRDVAISPTTFAEFQFTGTVNTQVICRSASATGASNLQSTTITLPNSLTTVSSILYTIEQLPDRINFSINNIVVATHFNHIPEPYTNLIGYISIENTGVTGSNTTITTDWVYFNNSDNIQIQNTYSGNPVAVSLLDDVHYISGRLTTTATTVDQVIVSMTVPTGKVLYLVGYTIDSDNIAATVIKIGRNTVTTETASPGTQDEVIFRSFHLAAGLSKAEDFGGNPRRIGFGGDVVKMTVTPSAATSTNWRGSLDFILR